MCGAKPCKVCWIATEVFMSELGTLKGYEAKISVDPNARPHFCKVRSVPYAMTGKVEEELE